MSKLILDMMLPVQRIILCLAIGIVALPLMSDDVVAQYDLSVDSTSMVFVAAADGEFIHFARYKRSVAEVGCIGDLPDGRYFQVEGLDSQPDPEHDPEPARSLAILLRHGVRVEEAWYSPRGRESTMGNMTTHGFPSALLLVRLDAEGADDVGVSLRRVDEPLSWLRELRSEYVRYEYLSGGREKD